MQGVVDRLIKADWKPGGQRHNLIEIRVSFLAERPGQIFRAVLHDAEWDDTSSALAAEIHEMIDPIVVPYINQARQADPMISGPFPGTTFRYSSVYQAQFPDCGVSDGKTLIEA